MTESNPRHSKWRDQYKVHPAADVFPMMSDEELDALGADIKANGLRTPITLWIADEYNYELALIDGRNRLEAMERAGIDIDCVDDDHVDDENPVTQIISRNIHRRHLTKQQQAELIVRAHKAAAEASPQVEEVPKKRHRKGKIGSEKDDLKAAIIADAAKQSISESTVERAKAKVGGRVSLPKVNWKEKVRQEIAAMPPPPRDPAKELGAARRHYLDLCADPGVDLDAEQAMVFDGFREIAGERMRKRQQQTTENRKGE